MATHTQRTSSQAGVNPDAARAAAQVVVKTHQRVSEFLKAGLTLAQVDSFVAKQLEDLGATSCFKGYTPSPRSLPPFPSHACLSLNECVVHGTAGYLGNRALREGDLFKVDIGVWYKGWVGDAAWTYCIGKPDELRRRLMDAGKRALAEGVQELAPGKTYRAWAAKVQHIVEKEAGFHMVRGLGGHGLFDARKQCPTLHGPPFVANRVPEFAGEWREVDVVCQPGTLIAVEPMIGATSGELLDKSGMPMNERWPEIIADRSLSVHYEHDVLITERGPEVLSAGLELTRDQIC